MVEGKGFYLSTSRNSANFAGVALPQTAQNGPESGFASIGVNGFRRSETVSDRRATRLRRAVRTPWPSQHPPGSLRSAPRETMCNGSGETSTDRSRVERLRPPHRPPPHGFPLRRRARLHRPDNAPLAPVVEQRPDHVLATSAARTILTRVSGLG